MLLHVKYESGKYEFDISGNTEDELVIQLRAIQRAFAPHVPVAPVSDETAADDASGLLTPPALPKEQEITEEEQIPPADLPVFKEQPKRGEPKTVTDYVVLVLHEIDAGTPMEIHNYAKAKYPGYKGKSSSSVRNALFNNKDRFDKMDDGRWILHMPSIPGVMKPIMPLERQPKNGKHRASSSAPMNTIARLLSENPEWQALDNKSLVYKLLDRMNEIGFDFEGKKPVQVIGMGLVRLRTLSKPSQSELTLTT